MAIATTATRAELVALAVSCEAVVKSLREIEGGSGSPAKPGRNTSVEIDALIVDLKAKIAAVEA